MPPKKKYRTIIMPQSGVLSMTASVSSSAVTEREERAQPDEDGRADREERVDHDVALRDLRVLRKVVRGRFRQQQKERVQAAQEALLIGPVGRRFHEAHQAKRRVREVGVVLVGAGPLRLLHAELVPLLARDLTGPAADAEGGVREHRERARHRYTTPFFTLQTKAFVSWM